MRKTLIAASMMAVTPAFAATTLTFQHGVAGYLSSQDTMIRSNETGSGEDSRGANYGTLDYISVLIDASMYPLHPSSDSPWRRARRQILYARSHWLRMPLHLLIPHLAYKAFIHDDGKAA